MPITSTVSSGFSLGFGLSKASPRAIKNSIGKTERMANGRHNKMNHGSITR